MSYDLFNRLSPQLIEVHKNLYKSEINRLEAEISAKEIELRQYKELLSELVNNTITAHPVQQIRQKTFSKLRLKRLPSAALFGNTDEYDMEWPLAKKAAFVIRQAGKGLTTRQIVDEIQKLEPNYLADRGITLDVFQKNVGATLNQRLDKGFKRTESEGVTGFIWYVADEIEGGDTTRFAMGA